MLLRTCPKNLNAQSGCNQILRTTQDDIIIGKLHFDTSSTTNFTRELHHKSLRMNKYEDKQEVTGFYLSTLFIAIYANDSSIRDEANGHAPPVR